MNTLSTNVHAKKLANVDNYTYHGTSRPILQNSRTARLFFEFPIFGQNTVEQRYLLQAADTTGCPRVQLHFS